MFVLGVVLWVVLEVILGVVLGVRDGRGRVFFLRGGAKVKIFRAGAGWGGTRQGSKSSGRGGVGQNMSISADLDHLLKEGKQ